VKDTARASIFGEPTDQLDVSSFTPRAVGKALSPDRAAVRRESEAAGFVSRQAPMTTVDPPILRRRRTGRNIQLNLKVDRETVDLLYRLADQNGWVLGETLRHALEALEATAAGARE
jgi:hypothetical protein